MPDSDVTRARRRRQHTRGDHHECGPKCTARRVAVVAAASKAETVTQAVDAFADAVAGWPADDPRRVSLALARAYAARVDAADGDWRMGESLVGIMRSLAVDPEVPADHIDVLNAQGASKTIEWLARQPRRPA